MTPLFVFLARIAVFAPLFPVAVVSWAASYMRRGYPLSLAGFKSTMKLAFRRSVSVATLTEYAGKGRVLSVSVLGGAGYVWSDARLVGFTVYLRTTPSTNRPASWAVLLAGGFGIDGKAVSFANCNDVQAF